MERVSIDAVDAQPHPLGVNRERRVVTDALDAEHLTMVHYALEPGEQFSGGLHTHHDQEEVFYVHEGTATFEHRPGGEAPGVADPDVDTERTPVAAGEAIRFAPGEFQCGRNESDDRVVGLAIAAPGSRHEWDAIESFAPCADCGTVTSHGVREPEEAFVIYCNDCGAEMELA